MNLLRCFWVIYNCPILDCFYCFVDFFKLGLFRINYKTIEMKKQGIKSLALHKKTISNLTSQSINGGTIITFTVQTCWSCVSCPTIDCSEGEICETWEETTKRIEETLDAITEAS